MKQTRLNFKTSQWMLIIIYFLVAMNLEIFKVFGDSIFLGNSNRYVLMVILFSAFIAFLIVISRIKISAYIWLIVLPIVLRVAIAVFITNQPGFRLYDLVQNYRGYFMVLFAIPIYYVLKYKATTVREFIKVLFLLMMLSMLLKAFVTLLNYFTGITVFPAFIYRETWRRYGLIRMEVPAIANLSVPMGIFLMDTEKKRSMRTKYMLMTILTIVFAALIFASRYTAIYQVAVLVYIMMMKKKSQAKSFVFFSILVGLILILLQTGIIDAVLGSFSVKNQELGGSTSARLVALSFFSKQISKHPILGNGIWMNWYTKSLNVTMRGYAMGDLTDIGVLYSVVQFGLIIGIPIAIFMIRLLVIGKRARRRGIEPYCILLWGTAVCFLLGGIMTDCFYYYIMSFPIALAVAEYCNYELLKVKNAGREVSAPIAE